MPRYQLALCGLLMVLAGWKKPSANVPFLETRLAPMASTWPPVIVSFAAEELQGVCKRRSPSNM
ncbi:hypothetical protein ZWY2020_027413 [Hordeum vulgare]|nr:hypothetical protein ZWY2020_027413 [Hordeum vulgare]